MYLLGTDFDGTLADTFSPSPNKIGVNEAYRLAIEKVFGSEGTYIYNQQGGLKNRAPTELVCDILAAEEKLALRARELTSAEWSDDPSTTIAGMLVQAKLEVLLGEISTRWPLFFPGVDRFLEVISILGISVGILSSGHEQFILKTFHVWGYPPPEFMVTEDDVRWRKYPIDTCRRVKPAVFPFAILHHRWLRRKMGDHHLLASLAKESRQRMLYLGDDPMKDGGLAANARVPFGLFNDQNKPWNPNNFPHGSFVFSDWNHLAEFLSDKDTRKRIANGHPCGEIFSQFKIN